MGLIFNLTIILCFILYVTSSAQDETNEQLTIEMRQMKINMSYLMSAVEKLQIEVQNGKTIELKVEKQISELNETIERALNMSKINSDEIDSIRQCLNISIKGCGEEDNFTHPTGPTKPIINQDQCNISEPSQLYQLSPDTLVYTMKNLNFSILDQYKEKAMESEVFSLDEHGINAQLKISVDSHNNVHSYLKFLRIKPNDTWSAKVYPRITYVMKVEKKGEIIDTSIRAYGYFNRFDNDTYNCERYFNYYSDKPEPKYEVGETFSIEVHVETPEMSNQFYSDNGTVKGTVCPYGNIREWASAKQIEWIPGPYFYTSSKGYRAVIAFYVGHKFDDSWLRVSFDNLMGLHDKHLKKRSWRAKVTLINQVDASRSVTQVEERSYAHVMLRFKAPSNVSEFVVNDELKYEASIEIIN